MFWGISRPAINIYNIYSSEFQDSGRNNLHLHHRGNPVNLLLQQSGQASSLMYS